MSLAVESQEQEPTAQLSTGQPSTEQPSTEQPSTEQPSTEQPSTERPSTERPSSDHLSAEQLSAGRLGLAVSARAHWPEHPGDTVPPLPGFVQAGFNPLVAEVAARCLRDLRLPAPARTGVVLASTRGDTLTPRLVTAALAEGRAVPPLLFYQSNPNAVAGQVAARWGLTGPIICTAPPAGDPAAVLADALGCAARLLADGEAGHVLVVVAEQSEESGAPEQAVALLVAPTEHAPADHMHAPHRTSPEHS
ncbi:hypothetical protein OG455_04680 [Kitasatospora sp. NBC_01287]|uniref:beta-ketoacyl synthase N-terminal-like domain-containing protein n=1 Tax=Kitasatospora sp. NBC_01287 TaxID=2903573 RepID=UPI002259753D|nr:beta-ketoacyl synthase N-terminal-like domain-containing protein [Kitasatospora sp. NBC_01287]MCX4744821.1 hypothetical protein [Kitasatospora sp. NBC_01287]